MNDASPAGAACTRPELTLIQRRTVRAIFDQVLPGAEVWVFGSRATGRSRAHSDLDLLVVQPRSLSWAQRATLRDAFEASDLPFRVDVVEADALSGVVAARVNAERLPLVPEPDAARGSPATSPRRSAG